MSVDGDVLDEPSEAQTVAGLKRRASSVEEQQEEESSKKQRIHSGKSSPQPLQTAAISDDKVETVTEDAPTTLSPEAPSTKETPNTDSRRKGPRTDEKQRSRRLFGALFSNVSSTGGDRVTKRRAEIEQRRKAELQKQDDERIEDRQKRLAKLAKHRKKEQIMVDERNIQLRHHNLLDEAQHLLTKAEPKLFYRPWELRPDEEDRISDQLDDARTQIEKEKQEFAIEKQRRLRLAEEDGPDDVEHLPVANDVADKPGRESGTTADEDDISGDVPRIAEDSRADQEAEQLRENMSTQTEDKTAPHEEPVVTPAEQLDGSIDKTANDENDDEGDHIVEGDEDTVIY